MAPSPPRLRILSVGGNAVSAFLSWRLQATNACDVTLVWKAGFEQVSQYGITFRSKQFGTERFKPRHVVPTPEDAGGSQTAPFDYVLLCVKALPDVYDLAAVIEPVVTAQHTCILVNTTHSIGVESQLEQRFPTNVILSLVSGAEILQLGPSEFEHVGSTNVWVGNAARNESIPLAIQKDMAEALTMTLNSGHVNCQVSQNIRQQQYERMIGPIAFHPLSVLYETPVHADLLEKTGVRALVSGVIDELLQLAAGYGCHFGPDFREYIIENLAQPADTQSIMYQDFLAKRPMEIETYLGSPVKMAHEIGFSVPRIETLYALLHHCNTINQQTLSKPPLPHQVPGPRVPPARGVNGSFRGGRAPPPMRRGPGPPTNGHPSRPSTAMNGRPPPSQLSRRPSLEGEDLNEFSHLMLYDETGYVDGAEAPVEPQQDMALRERELALRQRELQLREQEFRMRRGSRRPTPSRGGYDDEDDDDDDFFDPMAGGPPLQHIDPDNVDMMSVTSRRNRRIPSQNQIRNNPEAGMMSRQGMRSSHNFGGRAGAARNRVSSQVLDASMPSLHEDVLSNPMVAYSSSRYGTVDRKEIAGESRANSLTASRLNQLQGAGTNAGMNGAYPSPTPPRRSSQAPPTSQRKMSRASPPEDAYTPPRTPGGSLPPGPRHPGQRYPSGHAPGLRNGEPYSGVSTPIPGGPAARSRGPLVKAMRSLTGSASASGGSGDSAPADSDPSAHSSQSSLAARQYNARFGQAVGAQ